MKNQIKGFIIIFSSFILLVSCKKPKGEIKENAKQTAYSQSGYNYLFSFENNGADSIMPVFFAKAEAGNYKMILKSFVNGKGINKAFQSASGVAESWSVNIPDLNTIGSLSEYRLNDDGDFALDDLSFVPNDDRYKNGKIIATDDKVEYLRPSKSYTWPSDNAKTLFKVKRTKGTSVLEYDNCYRANLLKHGDRTYFLYNEPDNLDAYTFKANMYFQIEENGAIIRKERYTGDNMTTIRGGCDGQQVDGLEFYPLLGKKGDLPLYLLLGSRYSKDYNRINLFCPGNSNPLMSAELDLKEDYYMHFFLYKSELYLSTINPAKLYDDCFSL